MYKEKLLLTLFILLFFACTSPEKELNQIIRKTCKEYIEELKKDKINNNKVLISVDEKYSKDKSYTAYRIVAQPQQLYEVEVPDAFYELNGYSILIFRAPEFANKAKKHIKLKLERKGYYEKINYKIHSNYLEWVLVKDNADNSYNLIKGTENKPLEELILRMDK